MFHRRNSKVLLSQTEERIQSNGRINGSVKTVGNKTENIIKYSDLISVIIYILFFMPLMIYTAINNYFFKKPKSLQGKICLVTGAGRGLGQEICLNLVKLGAEIVCVDIIEDTNNETVRLIKNAGGKVHGYTCNVANKEEVTKLAETVRKEVGRVYLLINNAGLMMTHNAGEWPPDDVVSIYNVNVISHYWTISAFLPAMKEVNEGHIVNIGSLSAKLLIPGCSVYGATKTAIDYMLRVLRLELNCKKDNKIIVTSVHSSVVNTGDVLENLYSSGSVFMLNTKDTVEGIIDAIRYDKTSVIIPKILHITRFIPDDLIIATYKILKISVNVPNDSYKQKIPFYEIHQKCL